MRRITVLVLSLLFVVAMHATFAQTPPRRVDEPTPTPAPVSRPSATNEEVDDVVRIDTTLVTVPVSVRDRNGRFVPDLQKQDFGIYEDGIAQEIAYFAPIETPFTIVLLLDTSGSTWSKLGQIKDAAKAFVEQLRPDDQVGVISFGMGVKVHSNPTSDREKIRKGIEGASRGLSTLLYDAMENIMKKHLARIPGRKAVVLFTDGVDATSNLATYESTVHAAEELDALIYSIRYDTYDPAVDLEDAPDPLSGLRPPGIRGRIPLPSIGSNSSGRTGSGRAGTSRADYDRGARYLHKLSKSTGGRVYEASKDLRNLQAAFSHIAEELGRQYSIGYYPRKKGEVGERRKIKVRTNRTDVAVRSRDNYIYKGPGAVTQPPAGASGSDKQVQSPPVLQKKPFVGDVKRQP